MRRPSFAQDTRDAIHIVDVDEVVFDKPDGQVVATLAALPAGCGYRSTIGWWAIRSTLAEMPFKGAVCVDCETVARSP